MIRFGTTIRCLAMGTALCAGTALADFGALPTPLGSCPLASLAFYVAEYGVNTNGAARGACWLGPFAIGRFSFSGVDYNTPRFYDANEFWVLPGEQTSGFGGFFISDTKPGVTPSATRPFNNTGTSQRLFNFNFTVDPGPIIDDEQVTLDPLLGTIFFKQYFCLNDLFGVGRSCRTIGDIDLSFNSQTEVSSIFTTQDFTGLLDGSGASILDTQSLITLQGGSRFDGVGFGIRNVPEPGVWLLLGIHVGILGFGRLLLRRT